MPIEVVEMRSRPTLPLQPKTTLIAGTIKDDDGKPLADTSIELVESSKTMIRTIMRGHDGLYSSTELSAREDTVRETDPAKLPQRTKFGMKMLLTQAPLLLTLLT